MDLIILILPPWLYAVVITLIGRWGERFFAQTTRPRTPSNGWLSLVNILITTLLFLSLLPISVMSLFGPLLPFSGPQAGMAVAIAIILFGLLPVRLMEAPRTGWDYAFWALFIDFLRVGGAFILIGWLLSQ